MIESCGVLETEIETLAFVRDAFKGCPFVLENFHLMCAFHYFELQPAEPKFWLNQGCQGYRVHTHFENP